MCDIKKNINKSLIEDWIHLEKFPTLLEERRPVCFPSRQDTSENGSTLKENNFFFREAIHVFPFRLDPFSEAIWCTGKYSIKMFCLVCSKRE